MNKVERPTRTCICRCKQNYYRYFLICHLIKIKCFYMSLFFIQVYTNYDPLQTNNIQFVFQNINMTRWDLLVFYTK